MLNLIWDADKGAISPRPSPLSSVSFLPATYPRPVAPPKRVFFGHTAAQRPRFLSCLTHASMNQVQLSSGCRQGGDFTSNLATDLCLSLLPAPHPRPRYYTKASRRWPYGCAKAFYCPCLTPASKNHVELILGCRQGGDFTSKPRPCLLSLSPSRYQPKTRYYTRTSRRRPYGSLRDPSQSVPSTFKQESSSTQLEMPTRRRFHLNPRNSPLSLFYPPPTQDLFLHQNGYLSAIRQRYGSVFVRA
jgi:hypothetical protein